MDRVPIAAKADGPKDNKGRIQGINASTYYIRKPGPQSAPIIGGEEWRSVDQAMRPERPGQIAQRHCWLSAGRQRNLSQLYGRRLEKWHKEAEKRFLQVLVGGQGQRT